MDTDVKYGLLAALGSLALIIFLLRIFSDFISALSRVNLKGRVYLALAVSKLSNKQKLLC
ncbi:hypothetical protein PR729_21560 [Providencia rettgeri]|nr:hypothetical protein PR729_21560 [Providencia rettgeri]